MTTMTHADKTTTTLNRDKVAQHRDALVDDAVSLERRNGPTAAEWEAGLTAQDMRESARALRAGAARLTQVLACIDAGVAELPANLYPGK
jgi:acyl transferase domain-containing protein